MPIPLENQTETCYTNKNMQNTSKGQKGYHYADTRIGRGLPRIRTNIKKSAWQCKVNRYSKLF